MNQNFESNQQLEEQIEELKIKLELDFTSIRQYVSILDRDLFDSYQLLPDHLNFLLNIVKIRDELGRIRRSLAVISPMLLREDTFKELF